MTDRRRDMSRLILCYGVIPIFDTQLTLLKKI